MADYNSKYSGEQVETLLDQVASGNAGGGGGGGITVETDPIFSASPAATITAADKSAWSGKQDALKSGENIKTINGESILGEGDITIAGGVTEEYVNNAIADAITTTLNTPV